MSRLLLLACVGCGFASQGHPDGGGMPSFAVTLTVSQIEEHGSFSAHLVALDASGAVDSGYQGQPGFSTDWGDLTVLQGPRFLGGSADVMLSLNRETSGTLAHVTVSDGTATGVSTGIKVVAPAWQLLDASPIFERGTTWDTLLSEPRWLRKGGTDYLFYLGSTQGSSTWSRGLATSSDGITWTRNDQPVFDATTSGWDAGLQPSHFHVAFDGSSFVAIYQADAHPFGVARSSDGVSWTRGAMGLVPATGPACQLLYFPSTFFIDNGGYHVSWFQQGQACVSTSTDAGLSFGAMSPLSGMLQNGNFPFIYQVLKEGTVYRAWYQESGDSTLYATSSDGVTWVPSPSPAIPYSIQTVVWNEVELRYQTMILGGLAPGGFERLVRP